MTSENLSLSFRNAALNLPPPERPTPMKKLRPKAPPPVKKKENEPKTRNTTTVSPSKVNLESRF
jgi:hypothetical protein